MKWFTNWLPLSKNMQRWNMWDSNLCPICNAATEDTQHFLSCPNSQRSAYLDEQILKIEEQLAEKQIPTPVIHMMLHAIFPNRTLPDAHLRSSQALLFHQLEINAQTWGLISIQWHAQLEPFNPDPTQTYRTLRWLSSFLQQLWNTTWDLWRYRNGILHQQHRIGQYAKLQSEVKIEFAKGTAFLPRSAQHWVQIPLPQLLNKPFPFLESWLVTVRTIRKREQAHFNTITLTCRRTNLLRQTQ